VNNDKNHPHQPYPPCRLYWLKKSVEIGTGKIVFTNNFNIPGFHIELMSGATFAIERDALKAHK
jgi:hypothetical protein